jgi:hypothetical protein
VGRRNRYNPAMRGSAGLVRALFFAAVSVAACSDSNDSKSPDASRADADGGTPSATDASAATADATLDAPPGYVTVLVPDPDGPCALRTACGGDLTGNWVLVSECNRYPDNNGPEANSCDFAGISVQTTVWENKTLTISGGSFSGTTERLEGYDFAIPPTCLASTPCSQWAGLLQNSVDAYAVTASCTADSAGTCACSEIAPDPALSGTTGGTYQVSATGLFMASTSGNSSSMSYCVSGSQLTFFNPDGDWVYTYRKQ